MASKIDYDSQADKRHNERIPRDRQPPNRPTPPSKMIRPRMIIGVILKHTPPEHRKDVRNLAGEGAAREERFESCVGADGDGAEGGGDNENGEGRVVGCLGARAHFAEPGMARESFVAGIGEEDPRGGDELCVIVRGV